MENCYVKQYKGVVDDADLLKYGEMRFEMFGEPLSNSNNSLVILSSVEQKLKILTEGVTFTGGSNELTLAANINTSFTVTGPCIISVENKYKIETFRQQAYNRQIRLSIEDFKYAPAISIEFNRESSQSNNDISGNIADLPSSVTNLRIKLARSLYGDISSLPENMDAIIITNSDRENGVSGNLNSLHSNILRILNFKSSTHIIGCLEDVCQNSINKGKVSGTLEFTSNSNCKVVNDNIGNNNIRYVTYSSTGCTIGTASGGSDVATCVKSGTAGSYTFTWTDGNGNTYVPTY